MQNVTVKDYLYLGITEIRWDNKNSFYIGMSKRLKDSSLHTKTTDISLNSKSLMEAEFAFYFFYLWVKCHLVDDNHFLQFLVFREPYPNHFETIIKLSTFIPYRVIKPRFWESYDIKLACLWKRKNEVWQVPFKSSYV